MSRHFDVIVVVWALTLMVGFMLASLSRADYSRDAWTYPQNGPHWVVQGAP
jgi:hypothetical protein